MKTPLIPAIMPQNFQEIEDYVSLVRYDVSLVQLDIMDGKYVPEKTWPFHYGKDRDLEALRTENAAFPFWEEIDYELDLMVQKPEEHIDTWLGLGASRVIFHYASVHNWQIIKDIDYGVRNFVSLGLAVTIHDDLTDIYTLIDEQVVDFIQVMGIAHIGYQGEPFDHQSLEIITTLRNRYPKLTITVDGGVSIDTIGEIADAGAVQYVSGSGVFGSGIAQENIELLSSLVSFVE